MSVPAGSGTGGGGAAGAWTGSRRRNTMTLWILAAVAGSLAIFTILYIAYNGL
jgi:hypothetical protein